MVLAELGLKIKEAFSKLNKAEFVDKKLVGEILNAVGMALIKSDVKIKFVSNLQKNVKAKFESMEDTSGNKRLAVQRAVVSELQGMLTAKRPAYKLKKGKGTKRKKCKEKQYVGCARVLVGL